MPLRFWRSAVALVVSLFMLGQGTWVLAGTTGSINGVLTDTANGKPIPDARVTASSPSQSASTTTDRSGRFSFVSLAPDTYTITAEKQGFEGASNSGVTVQADQNLTVTLGAAERVQQIGRVTARSADSLVRPGQTASVYSVTPAQQAAAAPLGGGANLNSAFSAIASVPGVTVPVGNAGWGQTIQIRGGDYTQTGNEIDGIPINRAFDQYPSSNLSSLGSQEVQVYTGNAPADAQATGLAGFVNQVIKTGTYPGTISGTLGIGTPSFYNHANVEISGATQNRNLSWYLATGGYNQTYRVVNQYNGTGYLASSGNGSLYNIIAQGCGTRNGSAGCYTNASPFIGAPPYGPNGYAVADTLWGYNPAVYDRETIANVHIGIPKKDGSKDDIQLLYDYGLNKTQPNTNMFSWGPQFADVFNGTANNGTIPNLGTCPNATGTYVPVGTGGFAPTTCLDAVQPTYLNQNRYTGQLNAPFTPASLSRTTQLAFPNSPYQAPLAVANDRYDNEIDEFAINKVQYQHNIGSLGYIRAYAYTMYSSRIDNGIVGLYQSYVGAFSPDYTIASHSYGYALQGGFQINAQNLLNFNVGYTSANTSRYNDLTAAGSGTAPVAYLVNASNPTGGCYSGTGALVSCATAARYTIAKPSTAAGACGQVLCPTAGAPVVGSETALTCGTGPCQYYAINNGSVGSFNTVQPKFLNASISDTFKPTDRLTINASLRMDSFSYVMQNTNTIGNQLLVNDYNSSHCVSGTTIQTRPIGGACAAGFSPTSLSANSPNLTFAGILQPRVGVAYTLSPQDTLSASYGRFVQPAETSAVQATNVQAGTPSSAFFSNFGFSSFARTVTPEVSYNTDFSWAHQFRNTDLSMRLTPFFRKTKDEFANILVDPKTNFVALVNGQNRTATGVEFAFNKGDFARNGFAARFAYTYTYAYNQYKVYPNGGSFVTGINQAIANYNQYTSYCGSHGADPKCSQATATIAAAPCYAGGNPDPSCSMAGTVANPYYNMAPQGLLDPNGKYFPYLQEPSAAGVATSYLIPHVASLIMQYKKDRLRITPSLQFMGGSRYGTPYSTGGVAPETCGALSGTSAATDPRYQGTGASAGAGYDAASCTGSIFIPNPVTGAFDGIGQFTQPNLLDLNLQIAYDVAPHVTLQVTAANLYANCFGGSNVPWAVGGRVGCAYANALSTGNFYNPGDAIQPGFRYPYAPNLAGSLQQLTQSAALPTAVFFELQFKGL